MLMVKLPIYETKIVKLTADGTNDYLNGEIVRPGEFWIVNKAFVLDVNTSATDVRVGPYNGVDHFVLQSKPIATANVGVYFEGPFYVREGQRFRAHVVAATAADDLYLIFQYEKVLEE
jgi:hypothetical protein